jgi:hypothetical protein
MICITSETEVGFLYFTYKDPLLKPSVKGEERKAKPAQKAIVSVQVFTRRLHKWLRHKCRKKIRDTNMLTSKGSAMVC